MEVHPTFPSVPFESLAGMSDYQTVAKTTDFVEGAGQAFAVNGRMVAVFKLGDTYYAIDDFCPHMGASLAGGAVHEGCVTCPWHAWSFSIREGTWMDNKRIKVDTFPVRVQGDEVQVLVED
jgi:nitrite reductase (NADH) small subunit